jgi:hypothetical protein
MLLIVSSQYLPFFIPSIVAQKQETASGNFAPIVYGDKFITKDLGSVVPIAFFGDYVIFASNLPWTSHPSGNPSLPVYAPTGVLYAYNPKTNNITHVFDFIMWSAPEAYGGHVTWNGIFDGAPANWQGSGGMNYMLSIKSRQVLATPNYLFAFPYEQGTSTGQGKIFVFNSTLNLVGILPTNTSNGIYLDYDEADNLLIYYTLSGELGAFWISNFTRKWVLFNATGGLPSVVKYWPEKDVILAPTQENVTVYLGNGYYGSYFHAGIMVVDANSGKIISQFFLPEGIELVKGHSFGYAKGFGIREAVTTSNYSFIVANLRYATDVLESINTVKTTITGLFVLNSNFTVVGIKYATNVEEYVSTYNSQTGVATWTFAYTTTNSLYLENLHEHLTLASNRSVIGSNLETVIYEYHDNYPVTLGYGTQFNNHISVFSVNGGLKLVNTTNRVINDTWSTSVQGKNQPYMFSAQTILMLNNISIAVFGGVQEIYSITSDLSTWNTTGAMLSFWFYNETACSAYQLYSTVLSSDPSAPVDIELSPDHNILAIKTVYGLHIVGIILPDPQSGNPRIRLDGYYDTDDVYVVDTSEPTSFTLPQKDWHSYFFGGKLIVKELGSSSIPRQLINDSDVRNGLLGNMLSRGLIQPAVFERGTLGPLTVGDVGNVMVKSQEYIPTALDVQYYGSLPTVPAERTVRYLAEQHLYWKGYAFDSYVTSGLLIKVPLDQPISAYGKLNITGNIGFIGQSIAVNEKGGIIWYNLLGGGLEAIVGALGFKYSGDVVSWLAKKSLFMTAEDIMEYNQKIAQSAQQFARTLTPEQEADLDNLMKQLGEQVEDEEHIELGAWLLPLLPAVQIIGKRIGSALSGILATHGVVGLGTLALKAISVAFVIDGIFDAATESHIIPPKQQLVLINVPIFVDTQTGKKYTAIVLASPADEIGTISSQYADMIKQTVNKLGVELVSVDVVPLGKDRQEYNQLIAQGVAPEIELVSIGKKISTALGIPITRLKLTEVDIAGGIRTVGRSAFLQTFLGGLTVETSLVAVGYGIKAYGIVPQFYTNDSAEIASRLGSVTINGKTFNFKASKEGAVAEFSVPEGAESLAVQLPMGYSVKLELNASVALKRDLNSIGDYGYNIGTHYSWGNMIKLTRAEFLDMPYPMDLSEVSVNVGNDYLTPYPITSYVTLMNKTQDPKSPSGWRYNYVIFNPRVITPGNGGLMEYCKRINVTYYFKPPPDVSISILFNGTSITSSLARHATLIFNSSVAQPVDYRIDLRVVYNKGATKVYVMNDSFTGSVSVGANGTAMATYIIDKYVSKAIEIQKTNSTVAYVEVYGKIIYAPYDYIKSNDEALATYIPSPQLWNLYGKNATLRVFAYNMLNLSALSGVTVTVFNATRSFSAQTLANGTALISLNVGLYNITAKKDGYHDYFTTLYIYNSTSLNIPMIPATVTVIHAPNPVNGTYPPIVINNTNYVFLWTSVYWKDGAPFEGASVKITDLTNSKVYSAKTNGTGTVTMLLPANIVVKLEVSAVNPKNSSQTFYGVKQFVLSNHTWMVFRVPWTSSYFAPEVMIQSLQILTHRGQGYFYGNVSHLIIIQLWTNVKQNVTVFFKVVDATSNATVNTETLTYSLQPGVFQNFTWISINASKGMYVRVYAKIVQYQNDTDLRNNEMWSNTVFLKPFVDFSVEAYVKVLSQKLPYILLPNDQIEIDIKVKVPINTTTIPAFLNLTINTRNINTSAMVKALSRNESIVAQPGIVWRNYTVVLPWTDLVNVSILVTHPWQDVEGPNNLSFSIPLGAMVSLQKVKVGGIAGFVREGDKLSIDVFARSNIPLTPSKVLNVFVFDNTSSKSMGNAIVPMSPNMTASFSGYAPNNPDILALQEANTQLIRNPAVTHTATVILLGYADYIENNNYVFTYTVLSSQWLTILLAIILIILLIMAIVWVARKALFHTIEEETEKRMKFVKKKPSENKFVHKVEEERKEPKHFVHEVEHKEDQTSSESKKKNKFVRLKHTVEEGKKKFVKKKEQ